jgi:signal peptidase I
MEFLRKVYTFLIDTVQSLLLVFAIFLIVYVFLFQPFQVSGNSMYPNYSDGEYILTNKIALRLGQPKQGEVVVFKAPNDSERDYIKRVIGIPGDTVMIKDGNVYVNGQLLDQSTYLKPTVKTHGGSFLKENTQIVVPSGYYFVLGDNRPESSDSREWGFVSLREIIGKSFFVYWPLDKMGTISNPYGN